MKPQITIYDPNSVKIGTTFPRRAKGLVSNAKAKWLDESQKAIVLLSEEKEDRPIPNRKKSIVKDAYRESEEVVTKKSPFEIIKRSRKRTRELHTAFSAVLWLGALILFFGVNFLMGYRVFTLNPSDWSGAWLVFVIAAIIECGIEVYFSKNELFVLNETIDIRQISPNNTGEADLRGYQKKLMRKLRIMSSAVVWIALALVFLIVGYLFGAWIFMWIVFPLGVFFEFARNFVKKIKLQAS